MTSARERDSDSSIRVTRRVARNTLYLSVADVANKVLMFGFFVVVARHLGAERFGLLSFALAYVGMFAVLTDFGLGPLTAREIARNHTSAAAYTGASLSIKVLAAVFAVALAVVTARILNLSTSSFRVVAICSLFILTSTVTLYYAFVFQGFERMQYTALSRLGQTAVLFVGALLLIRQTPSAESFAWLYVSASAISASLVLTAATGRLVKPRLTLDVSRWAQLLRQTWPFGLASVFAMLYYWNGSALMSWMLGDLEVGLYNAPLRLVLGLGFVALSFSGAVYPVMSRFHLEDPERLARLLRRSLRLMIVLAVPLATLGAVLAKPVVLLVYGSEFASSAPVLRILVCWGGLVCLNTILSSYVYSINRPGVVALQTGIALALNVALNLLLMPLLRASGAAVAILAAELFGCLFLLGVQRRSTSRVRGIEILVPALRSLAAVAPATILALVVLRVHVLLALLVGIAAYSACSLLFRSITAEDMASLRAVVSR